MNSFVVRQKGTRNRFLEGFYGGGMSNFMSITAKGWLDFESLSEIKEYFEYVKDELLRIGVEHPEKLAVTKRELKKLKDFEILEISDKKVVNVFDIENLEQFDFTDIVITKDNIALYYEFMSVKEIERLSYKIFWDDKKVINLFMSRCHEIIKRLNMSFYDAPDFVNVLDCNFSDLQSNKKRDRKAHIPYNGLTCQCGSYFFGIKDTLKPIEEYIAEIKQSSEYKEYILKLANNDILNQCGVLNFDWLFDGKKWFFNVDDIDSFVVTYLNENTFRLSDGFSNFVMDFEATNKDDLLLQIFNFFNHKNILIEDTAQE
ncbi:MAG: hypothetical protein U9Q66_00450 [Patescibacteria group bacterium]|nr:hypothetical protein [Patescibacteria group bacterium]